MGLALTPRAPPWGAGGRGRGQRPAPQVPPGGDAQPHKSLGGTVLGPTGRPWGGVPMGTRLSPTGPIGDGAWTHRAPLGPGLGPTGDNSQPHTSPVGTTAGPTSPPRGYLPAPQVPQGAQPHTSPAGTAPAPQVPIGHSAQPHTPHSGRRLAPRLFGDCAWAPLGTVPSPTSPHGLWGGGGGGGELRVLGGPGCAGRPQ